MCVWWRQQEFIQTYNKIPVIMCVCVYLSHIVMGEEKNKAVVNVFINVCLMRLTLVPNVWYA